MKTCLGLNDVNPSIEITTKKDKRTFQYKQVSVLNLDKFCRSLAGLSISQDLLIEKRLRHWGRGGAYDFLYRLIKSNVSFTCTRTFTHRSDIKWH